MLGKYYRVLPILPVLRCLLCMAVSGGNTLKHGTAVTFKSYQL